MVRDYVTFHFYFPYKHRQKGDILKWDAVLKNKVDCKTPPPTSSNTYRYVFSVYHQIVSEDFDKKMRKQLRYFKVLRFGK